MPDAMGRYNDAERRAYPAPNCSICGARGTQQWADARALADTEAWWVPGMRSCPKAKDHPRTD